MSEEPETYTIMELAREFSITPRTIRFYEDKGLLHPARAGNNRIYNRRDRARLMLILRGKRLGFSLRDIGETIDLYDGGQGEQYRATLQKVKERIAALDQQRDDIEVMLAELRRAESSLESVLETRAMMPEEEFRPELFQARFSDEVGE